MWTWLPVIALILIVFCWMGWVLHRRRPPGPGEEQRRQEHRHYFGIGGS